MSSRSLKVGRAAGVLGLPTEHKRIGVGLELLTQGLLPFFQQELHAVYGEGWEMAARASFRNDKLPTGAKPDDPAWDAHAVLTIMWDQWNAVFRRRLGLLERSLVGELREYRNRWVHQSNFSEDDCYRVLDSAQRLLHAVHAKTGEGDLERLKLDILREKFGRKVNEDLQRARFSRERMTDILLYSVCALAIIISLFLFFGSRQLLPSIVMASFVVFTFAFLIFKRINAAIPVYGVHECQKCRRIIYSECCPYCEPAQLRQTMLSPSAPQPTSLTELLPLQPVEEA